MRSPNTLSVVRGAFTATLMSTVLLAGCSNYSESPKDPSIGIVTVKDDPRVNGDCLYSDKGICYLYEQVTEYDVTISACRRIDGKVVLADRDYLENHQTYPSDYPINREGIASQGDGSKVSCDEMFTVDETTYRGVKEGQIITASQLR